ncbi:MAG: hypothetical protein QS721_14925 [Candidatus Endonucleobacter sp. (ex Gigantidas childressi)]|nr:hypothetical protein [Candidatus Endonucleobacter sp. (ex Gigantidas childressi)]
MFNVHQGISNMLCSILFILTLFPSPQSFPALAGEHDIEQEKKFKNTIRSIFFHHAMESYEKWINKNEQQRTSCIIGSAGIQIHVADAFLNDTKDIDILFKDKNQAISFLEYLNIEMQKILYTLPRLKNALSVNVRSVGKEGSQPDRVPECGQITVFDNATYTPIASVEISVKQDWIEDDDLLFDTLDYYFPKGVTINGKQKVSIPVLTPKGYCYLDVISIKHEIEHLQPSADNNGLEDPEEKTEELKSVLYSCQCLYKTKNRLHFYETKKHNDISLMDMIKGPWHALLQHIKSKTYFTDMIHQQASSFSYVQGTSNKVNLALPSTNMLAWEKILTKDYHITHDHQDGDPFYSVISNLINSNRKVANSFLKAATTIIPDNKINTENWIVTPELLRVFLHQWISLAHQGVNNGDDNQYNDNLTDLVSSSISIPDILSKGYIKSSSLPPGNKEFSGWPNLLFPLTLATGIPVVVFTPDHNKTAVHGTLFSPEMADGAWPKLIKTLANFDNLITKNNTMINDALFIIHLEDDSYHSCYKQHHTEKKLQPLLRAEELLLAHNPFEYNNYYDAASEDSETNNDKVKHINEEMYDETPWVQQDDSDQYLSLAKKLSSMCIDYEVNGDNKVGENNTKDHETYLAQYLPSDTITKEPSTKKGISEENRGNHASLNANTSVKEIFDIGYDSNNSKATDQKHIDSHLASTTENTQSLGAIPKNKIHHKKQVKKNRKNEKTINTTLQSAFDIIRDQNTYEQDNAHNMVIINLEKCSDETVKKHLSHADDCGSSVAPLVLGVYQMYLLGRNHTYINKILGIIRFFKRSAARGNIQALACLYWLAKTTGSPEAFSASFLCFPEITCCVADQEQTLHFRLQGPLEQEKSDLNAPIFFGICAKNKKPNRPYKFLATRHEENIILEFLSSSSSLSQLSYEEHKGNLANTVIHLSHLGHFYLLSGDPNMATTQFKKAALGYSILMRNADCSSTILDITKAAGLSALYHTSDKKSLHDSACFLQKHDTLQDERTNHLHLWILKSYMSETQHHPTDWLEKRITYFVHRKKEGIIFKSKEKLEEEVNERNSCFYVPKPNQGQSKEKRLNLDLLNIDCQRSCSANKKITRNKKSMPSEILFVSSPCQTAMRDLDNRRIALFESTQHIFQRTTQDKIKSNTQDEEYFIAAIELIKECIQLLSQVRETKDCHSQDMGWEYDLALYNINALWDLVLRFDLLKKLDAAVAEAAITLSEEVSGKIICSDKIRTEDSFSVTNLKYGSMILLNPVNYSNISVELLSKVTKCFLRSTKAFSNDNKNKMCIPVHLLNHTIDNAHGSELSELVIETSCKMSSTFKYSKPILSKGLLDYYIYAENNVSLDQRQCFYSKALAWLEKSSETKTHDTWQSLVMAPHHKLIEEDVTKKKHMAAAMEEELVFEEHTKSEQEQKKKEAEIKSMLQRRDNHVRKTSRECASNSAFIKKQDDRLLSDTKDNKVIPAEHQKYRFLTDIYEQILNKEFEAGFCNLCKARESSTDGHYLATISILKFECQLEDIQNRFPHFKTLHNQSKLTKSYLYQFEEAEKKDILPVNVQLAQLECSYNKIKDIAATLDEKDNIFEQAINSEKEAALILEKLLQTNHHETINSELSLLSFQKDKLFQALSNIETTCENICAIISVRRKCLRKIEVSKANETIEKNTNTDDYNEKTYDHHHKKTTTIFDFVNSSRKKHSQKPKHRSVVVTPRAKTTAIKKITPEESETFSTQKLHTYLTHVLQNIKKLNIHLLKNSLHNINKLKSSRKKPTAAN